MISGMPMWLGEQFWTLDVLRDAPPLLDHLFAICREALAAAVDVEFAPADAEAHARGILLRIARGLRAPVVPAHPELASLIDVVASPEAEGLARFWTSFVERPWHGYEVEVTFRPWKGARTGMFAFKYKAHESGGAVQLHNCYTVWRSDPALT